MSLKTESYSEKDGYSLASFTKMDVLVNEEDKAKQLYKLTPGFEFGKNSEI